MKPFLFSAISRTTYAIIWVLDQSVNLFARIVAYVAGALRWLVAKTGQFLMEKLTPEQFNEVQRQIEFETQQAELKLLSSASDLKEHAVDIGEWTESHTEALNAIGNALLNDCNWEEQHVHDYLRRVVESVPGLQYGHQDPDEGY